MKYTLGFDVYGTLIDTSGIFNSLKNLMGEKAKQFMDTWRNKQLEYSFRRGIMNTYADFSVCTKDALEFCCLVYETELNQIQKDSLMEEYNVLPIFPDILSGLQTLQQDEHKIFAFSNGSKKAILSLLTNAGIIDCFDGIVSVEDVMMFKPSPLVYGHFVKKTGSSKSSSWLISGNPFDVIGAISYGMRSAWVQRSTDIIFDPWGIKPTITIERITDLSLKLRLSP